MTKVGGHRYPLVWVAVLPLALWAALRSLGLDGGSWLVPLMAFTPYATIAGLLVAGVATALSNWAAAAVAALATLTLALAVLPRAIGDGTVDAAGHETLSVLSANVRRGRADPEALVDLVRRFHPDLLAIEELRPRFARELDAAGIRDLLPNQDLAIFPGLAMTGVGVYSRLPLRPTHPHDNSGVGAQLQLPSGRTVRVVAVHPYTPAPGHIGEWQQTLAELPSAGRGPLRVLLGDFNATLDQAELRRLVDRGYRDAGDVAGKGLEPTFPQEGWAGLGPLITIDHVLADRRLGIVEYGVADLPGSDHRAIQAVLALPRAPGAP